MLLKNDNLGLLDNYLFETKSDIFYEHRNKLLAF